MKLSKWLITAFLLATLCRHASAQVFNVFQPGCALGGTWNSQSVSFANSGCFLGNLPAANQQSIASPTFIGNDSGATGAGGPLNPLAASTMMSAVLSVDVTAGLSTNLTLSGIQTIDGVSGFAGEFVLAAGQTTTSQNGIYVMASGAWSRAANFPAGYVIGQNCEIVILIKLGSVASGTEYYIPTSAAITIGTTSFSPVQVTTFATATRSGTVEIGGGLASAMQMGAATSGPLDCMSFGSAANTAKAVDNGDAGGTKGPCSVQDINSGHLVINNNENGVPSASTGTINAHSTDHWGIVTGLSTATSETITFAATFTNPPACTANDSQAATPISVSAVSATAVTFNFASLTGSLYYNCFGTN